MIKILCQAPISLLQGTSGPGKDPCFIIRENHHRVLESCHRLRKYGRSCGDACLRYGKNMV